MYNIKVKKENATTLNTIKVIVDNNVEGRLLSLGDNLSKDSFKGKEIYLKGNFVSTNKIILPDYDGDFTLAWKQNYLFAILLVIICIILAVLIVGSATYTGNIRFFILIVFGLIINFTYNDMLLLGRKIYIKE